MSQKQEDAMSVAQTVESVDLAPAMHIVEADVTRNQR